MEKENNMKRRGPPPKNTTEELMEELDMWIRKRDVYKLERKLEYKKALLKDKDAKMGDPGDKEKECLRKIKNIRTQIYRRKE